MWQISLCLQRWMGALIARLAALLQILEARYMHDAFHGWGRSCYGNKPAYAGAGSHP